jgi:hypothetical protein
MWQLKVEDGNYNRFKFEINDLDSAKNLIKAMQEYSTKHLEYNLGFKENDDAATEEEGEE